MKKHLGLFLLILALVAMLRLAYLGTIPAGFSWDEAAIGYNGFGIATVHRDEWLVKTPVSFRSFGDYKAAVAIYAVAITTSVFGLTPFAVRLPMALAGIATTIAAYCIALAVLKKRAAALLTMLFVAVSPINVHFSRIAFESGIAVALVSWMVACLVYAKRRPWLYVAGAIFGVLSLYAYHSVKISLPFMLLVFAIAFRKQLWAARGWVALAIVLAGVLLIPLFQDSVNGNGAERFYMTSAVMTREGFLPLSTIARNLAENTQKHLSLDFLVFGQSPTLRHGNGVFGIFSYLEFFFIVVAMIQMVRRRDLIQTYWWLLALMLIAFLPAIISTETPHSNRAHGLVPWAQMLAAMGAVAMWQTVVHQTKFRKLALLIVALLFTFQTTASVRAYMRVYTGTPAAREFQYGYLEAVHTAIAMESQVDKVLFTSAYGQPYIFILFGKRLTPIAYQQGSLANYEIRDIHWDSDKQRTRTLFVGTPQEIPSDTQGIVKEIPFPDGSVAFRIVKQ